MKASLVTARVRSTTGGYIFTLFTICLGGRYLPYLLGWGGTHLPKWGGGYLPSKVGGYLPSGVGGTYPGGAEVPTLVGGGYLPSERVLETWRAVCLLRSRRRTFLYEAKLKDASLLSCSRFYSSGTSVRPWHLARPHNPPRRIV